ncbi:MAG TPA: hypothetical protein DCL21_01615 [Alphaproteobacteria bacterium]|nr:hypothetical protein [Alphaproteobacteria bacterium]
MSNIELVRNDIDNIINEENEFGNTITYNKVTNTYDDDNSINNSNTTDYSIVANVHPENNDELKVGELGQVIFGTGQIFFKHEYIIDSTTTITPKLDDSVIIRGTKYRIKQLKPWIVNSFVAYYEGRLVREDLNE